MTIDAVAIQAQMHTQALRTALGDIGRVDPEMKPVVHASAVEHLESVERSLTEIRRHLYLVGTGL